MSGAFHQDAEGNGLSRGILGAEAEGGPLGRLSIGCIAKLCGLRNREAHPGSPEAPVVC